MEYRLKTVIENKVVTVECDKETAQILLPLWSSIEPNMTECREIVTNRCIVAWIDIRG